MVILYECYEYVFEYETVICQCMIMGETDYIMWSYSSGSGRSRAALMPQVALKTLFSNAFPEDA